MDAILNAMQVLLSEIEREQLYHELLAYFGLIGAADECQALEAHGKTHIIGVKLNTLSMLGFQGGESVKKNPYLGSCNRVGP